MFGWHILVVHGLMSYHRCAVCGIHLYVFGKSGIFVSGIDGHFKSQDLASDGALIAFSRLYGPDRGLEFSR